MCTTAVKAPSANSDTNAAGSSHFQASTIDTIAPNKSAIPIRSFKEMDANEPIGSPAANAKNATAIKTALIRAVQRTISLNIAAALQIRPAPVCARCHLRTLAAGCVNQNN